MRKELAARNNLLSKLDDGDFDLIEPHLEPVDLKLGEVLIDASTEVEDVYFVVSGLISVIAAPEGSRDTEVGVYGFEGMGPTAILMGSDQCPFQHTVQFAGSALRINTNTLRHALEKSCALRDLLLRYAQTFNVLTAYTAYSNGGFTVGQRLARWLLMCQDRIHDPDIELTHNFLAKMLNVRRAGVTDALIALEGEKIVEATRGRIRIIDRRGLEAKAGKSYGVPEAEYRRLIGPPDLFA